MFKYEPTLDELVNAYTVAFGDDGERKLAETLLSFLSDADLENAYARALRKIREDMMEAGVL